MTRYGLCALWGLFLVVCAWVIGTAAVLTLLATIAHADVDERSGYLENTIPETDNSTWHTSARSHAVILPTDEPNCVAEVHIHNQPTDSAGTLSGSIEIGDISVGIVYWLNVDPMGAERYALYPPDGYIAIPPEIVVLDNEDGMVLICQWLGF